MVACLIRVGENSSASVRNKQNTRKMIDSTEKARVAVTEPSQSLKDPTLVMPVNVQDPQTVEVVEV